MNPEVITRSENFFLGWLNDPTVAKFVVLFVGVTLIQLAASLVIKGTSQSPGRQPGVSA